MMARKTPIIALLLPILLGCQNTDSSGSSEKTSQKQNSTSNKPVEHTNEAAKLDKPSDNREKTPNTAEPLQLKDGVEIKNVSPNANGEKDAEWKNAVAFDTTLPSFTAQQLKNYINSHYNYFTLSHGDTVLRCVNEGEENNLKYPIFFARTRNFRGFQANPFGGISLCSGRNLYKYTVKQDISFINFLDKKRYELPNLNLLPPLASVVKFHHILHQQFNLGEPQYSGHILDKTIDASLNETPDQTKKILKTKHAQAIGRVVYFCNEVIQDPISKDHNSIHHVNGWIDYDVGFAPPAHHEIPISQMQIEEKEELLLCSPDQYLAPNPQLLEEGMP